MTGIFGICVERFAKVQVEALALMFSVLLLVETTVRRLVLGGYLLLLFLRN